MTLKDVYADVRARTSGSQQAHARSTAVLATAAVGTLAVPYPIYVQEARGSRVMDVDGNEYIDLAMGFGPNLLGHAPAVTVDTIREAVGRGTQYALHNPYQEQLATLLLEAYGGAEKVFFCNTGTEATMHAVRAARAFTGRTKVAIFEGSYHGSHDYSMLRLDSGAPGRNPPATLPWCSGIPAVALGTVMVLPFHSREAFDLVRGHREDLAVVMIEPVQSNTPRLDHLNWLAELRDVCAESGVLFMFDEVFTGFRIALGGGRERFDIAPDLATFGKILGGGLPIGAIAGRADIVGMFQRPEKPTVFAAGTYSGNPLSMATGTAMVRYLRDHPAVYQDLEQSGHHLADGINDACRRGGIPAEAFVAGSALAFHVQPPGSIKRWRDIVASSDTPAGRASKAAADALYVALLALGVIVPGIHGYVLSAAHSRADLDQCLAAFDAAFALVEAEGLFDAVRASFAVSASTA